MVNTLARAGATKLRIVDFDLVSVSSLNRHAFSYRKDVGSSKVESIKKQLKKINPKIECQIIEEFLNKDNTSRLLAGNPDYVADCIDDLETKAHLIKFCHENGIKVISSGGAGMKADPTKVQIRDISSCTYDSLTRRLRERVKRWGIVSGVDMVFSPEVTKRTLLPLKEFQEEDPDNFRQLPGMRLRIVPVLGTMPAIFGVYIADFILKAISGKKGKVLEPDDARHSNYKKMADQLLALVKRLGLDDERSDFDIDDVYFAVREVWGWRNAITGKKRNHLALSVWDRAKKVNGLNLILVGKLEAKRLNDPGIGAEELEAVKLELFGGEGGVRRVDSVLEEARGRYEAMFPLYNGNT